MHFLCAHADLEFSNHIIWLWQQLWFYLWIRCVSFFSMNINGRSSIFICVILLGGLEQVSISLWCVTTKNTKQCSTDETFRKYGWVKWFDGLSKTNILLLPCTFRIVDIIGNVLNACNHRTRALSNISVFFFHARSLYLFLFNANIKCVR